MKVAIVDDDPIVCSSIATILAQTGNVETVWTAHDGSQAVKLYHQHRPEILLMDVQMPVMSGLDAATMILDEDHEARILFLTTFADKQYIEQALALGGRGYLIKQDVEAILPAVQTVMAGEIVLGSQALSRLSIGTSTDNSNSIESAANFQNSIGNENSVMQADNPVHALTAREQHISALIAQGLDNHDIAQALYLSEGTVRNRISEILAKLNLANRTQLAIAWIHAHPDVE